MALYPAAVKRLIPAGGNDPRIKACGVILHVDAGNVRDLYNYFNGPSNGIESHFHIAKDGTVFQYRDTDFEADANYKGNSFLEGGVRKGYISVETQGLEYGEWTPAQVEALKALILWLSKTHGFPIRKCRDPRDPGVGYHTLFGAPSAWTPVSKSCPGPDRKKQFERVFVPWFAELAKPAPAPEPKPEPKPAPDTCAPAPAKPEPAPVPRVTSLSPGVRPGARHAQVPDVKRVLKAAGYTKGLPVAPKSTKYGVFMQRAVARFHKANPQFSSGGFDPALGPKGWAFLQRKIGRR